MEGAGPPAARIARLDLDELPAPGDPDFGQNIRRLDMTLTNPERDFRAGLSSTTATRGQRFACLYGLLTRLRREYRFNEYKDLAREAETEFGGEPHFEHFRVVIARWTGDDARSIRLALEASERAVAKLPNDPGILNQYSELVASLAEVDEVSAFKYADRAMDRVDKSIDMSPYSASFYATRARLNILRGGLDAARYDIERAISSEDSRSPDYARRISRYESIRLLIIIRYQQQGLEKKQQAVLADLDQFKSQQLSLLSLFATLIALLAVTATIATRVSGTDAIRLIVASGGVIVVTFGAVTAVLTGVRIERLAIAFITGISLIIAAALISLF